MPIASKCRATMAHQLVPLAVSAALLSPGSVVVGAATAAAAAAAPPPLPCLSTIVQMVNGALFSGTAGEHKLATLAHSPGRRLLPATGAPTPQAALIGQFGAKTAEGQCAFETTAYVAVPLLLLLGLFNLSPEGKAAEKKLESLSPAQKKTIDNFFVTGMALKGTNPLALLGGAHNPGPALGTGPLVKPGYRKLTVKLTKLTPTGATMSVSGLEAGTETVAGHTQTIWVPFSQSGIEASKVDTRWFLSGAKGLNFTA